MKEETDIEEQMEQVFSLGRQLTQMEAVDVNSGWDGVKQKIRSRVRHRRAMILMRVAAILALPLLLSTIVLGYQYVRQAPITAPIYAETTSAPGTVTRLVLPDQSTVWLNANSLLRYPTTFSGNGREVFLEGEGYFEVKSNPDYPFVVGTQHGVQVMAHGTHFSVSTEGHIVRSILAEGNISVCRQTDELPLAKLHVGEQFTYNDQTKATSIGSVNLHEKLAWKDGKIIFRDSPLDEVFRQLGRRYNVDIILHDTYRQIDKYSARVTFQDETIQQIFTYLALAAPIRWKLSSPERNVDSTLVRQRIDVWLTKNK